MENLKQAIKELVTEQVKVKSERKSNDYRIRTSADYLVKVNRDKLFVMYVAYFILKHKLSEEDKIKYLNDVMNHAKWRSGWNGFGLLPINSTKEIQHTYLGRVFIKEVNDLIDKYAEEIVCSDRSES